MKKFILFAVLTLVTFTGCETKMVTSYFLFSYTPSDDGISNAKIERKTYINDSIALSSESKLISDNRTKVLNMLENEPLPKQGEEMLYKAKIKAYESILKEVHTLICFIHPDGFDVGEFITVVKKNGIKSKETKKYIEDNNLEVRFVPLD